ncbi:MAG: 4-hydroxy-3-methylbut-2-enyl diphosphate reductase [bacterium]
MVVKLARTAGFCMGVRLAVDKVLAIAEHSSGPVYTYGPLIHNRQAVDMLESKGVRDLDDAPDASSGTVLLRAHGVPREEKEALRERGFDVVDATCPHVLASQKRIEHHAAAGYSIVIAGDREHAEVRGLVSHAGHSCAVVSTPDEARGLEVSEPVCLVAQTTFNERVYAEIAAVLRARFSQVEVLASICRATHRRQEEVLELAGEVEAVVVVGGFHSANTRRLAELARARGVPTFHVETAADLDVEALSRFHVVGLTAGASTPNWVTRSVLQALRDIGRPVSPARWAAWRALAALTRSNVYSALAATALTYASCLLAGMGPPRRSFLLATFCYVFAVTTLNRLARGDREEGSLPARVAFYQRHVRPLLVISLLFWSGSLLVLTWIEAWRAMILLVAAYVLGVAYSVRLVPRRWQDRIRYSRLRDIPGSKDIFVALALVGVCVLAPWLEQGRGLTLGVVVACVFAFVLTFVRAAMVDLGDMQEDYLLGRETLPILLGERRTRRLMAGLSIGLAALLALATAMGWTPPMGWLLLACPAYLLAYVWLLHRQMAASDVLCALVSDGALLLAGLLALVWTGGGP